MDIYIYIYIWWIWIWWKLSLSLCLCIYIYIYIYIHTYMHNTHNQQSLSMCIHICGRENIPLRAILVNEKMRSISPWERLQGPLTRPVDRSWPNGNSQSLWATPIFSQNRMGLRSLELGRHKRNSIFRMGTCHQIIRGSPFFLGSVTVSGMT